MPSHSREADERALDVNEEAYSLSEEERTEWYLLVPPRSYLSSSSPISAGPKQEWCKTVCLTRRVSYLPAALFTVPEMRGS